MTFGQGKVTAQLPHYFHFATQHNVNVPTHLAVKSFKQFLVCINEKLTGAAVKSRSEHHIPLSTSSLGSWKSAVKGARRSNRLIIQ